MFGNWTLEHYRVRRRFYDNEREQLAEERHINETPANWEQYAFSESAERNSLVKI